MSIYDGCGPIDVEELLNQLDLDNVSRGSRGEIAYSCPFQSGHTFGDAHPSAHMNEDKLVFNCKTCHRAGTALDLVGAVLHCTPIEALRWLRERFGEEYREPRGGSVRADMQERLRWMSGRHQRTTLRLPDPQATLGERGIFHVDWASDHPAAEYMCGRGFRSDTLDSWPLGYDHWTERVVLPLRSAGGVLRGFKGRATDDRRIRYLLLGDAPDRALRFGVGYGFDMTDETPRLLFGLDRAVNWIGLTGADSVVLCEGELDAMAVDQAGQVAVASGTSSLSTTQAHLLRSVTDEVVIFYDSDEAGIRAMWGFYDEKERWHNGLVQRLSPFMRVRVVDDHKGDPASLRPDEVRDLVHSAKSWLRIATA